MRNPFGANPRDLQRMLEQTMQQMRKAQEELKNLRVESSVGGVWSKRWWTAPVR